MKVEVDVVLHAGRGKRDDGLARSASDADGDGEMLRSANDSEPGPALSEAVLQDWSGFNPKIFDRSMRSLISSRARQPRSKATRRRLPVHEDSRAVMRVIHTKSEGSGVELANVKMSIDPFAEIAVGEALRQKDAGKATEIVIADRGISSRPTGSWSRSPPRR